MASRFRMLPEAVRFGREDREILGALYIAVVLLFLMLGTCGFLLFFVDEGIGTARRLLSAGESVTESTGGQESVVLRDPEDPTIRCVRTECEATLRHAGVTFGLWSLFSIGIAGWCVWGIVRHHRRRRWVQALERRGVTAVGGIVDREIEARVDEESNPYQVFWLVYRFEPGGALKQRVPPGVFPRWPVGAAVAVRYLPEDPRISYALVEPDESPAGSGPTNDPNRNQLSIGMIGKERNR